MTSPTAIKASARSEHFAQNLLRWYDTCGRTLPWRNHPPNPYHVWISEIMLQQTTVLAVIPYFNRWIHRWPTLHDFAHAPIHDVLEMWQGLGYYTRAYNLHKCANALVRDHNGRIPGHYDTLLNLPGIGHYTAGSIGGFAFDQEVLSIDGNIARLFARVLAKTGDKNVLMSELPSLIRAYLPRLRMGDYTQALMDLGSLICKPKTPLCTACPIQQHCQSYQQQTVHLFPEKKVKSEKPKRYGHFFCILKHAQRGDKIHILLEQESGRLLHGLWRPLTSPWKNDDSDPIFPLKESFTKAGDITHVFTHFSLFLHLWVTILPDSNPIKGQWDDLSEPTRPLSSLARKALKRIHKTLSREAPLRLAS